MVSSDRFIKIENQYRWREKYHVTLIMQTNRKTPEIFSVQCIYMPMYNTADSKAGENHRDHKNTQSIYTYILTTYNLFIISTNT